MSRDGLIWASWHLELPALPALGTAQQFFNQLLNTLIYNQPKSVTSYQTKIFSLINEKLKRTSIILHNLKPFEQVLSIAASNKLTGLCFSFRDQQGNLALD